MLFQPSARNLIGLQVAHPRERQALAREGKQMPGRRKKRQEPPQDVTPREFRDEVIALEVKGCESTCARDPHKFFGGSPVAVVLDDKSIALPFQQRRKPFRYPRLILQPNIMEQVGREVIGRPMNVNNQVTPVPEAGLRVPKEEKQLIVIEEKNDAKAKKSVIFRLRRGG